MSTSVTQPAVETTLDRVLGVPSFVARLIYFLIAPGILVGFATRYTMTGAIINFVLTIGYFMASPYLSPHLDARPRLAKVFTKFRRFEAYYREHPPRIFPYYVLYPLLFPYWLFFRRGRREFLLYRSMGALAVLVIVGTGAWQFFHDWYPEIAFGRFARSFVVCFVLQVVAILFFMVPIATSTVAYQLGRKRGRLAALWVAAALSIGVSVAVSAAKRHDIVPYMTAQRLKARYQTDKSRGDATLASALDATKASGSKSEVARDVPGGAEILGPRLDAARAELAKFWKEEEAELFLFAMILDLEDRPIFVLYAPDDGGKPLLSRAFEPGGRQIDDLSARIGDRGFATMKKISKK